MAEEKDQLELEIKYAQKRFDEAFSKKIMKENEDILLIQKNFKQKCDSYIELTKLFDKEASELKNLEAKNQKTQRQLASNQMEIENMTKEASDVKQDKLRLNQLSEKNQRQMNQFKALKLAVMNEEKIVSELDEQILELSNAEAEKERELAGILLQNSKLQAEYSELSQILLKEKIKIADDFIQLKKNKT
ncbi:hypothetical protein [Lactococcus sp.]|uniref:hypothetical protein n=1 Tax=Lactococcus sp. TaxID=44273 RepID=UPI0035AF250B